MFPLAPAPVPIEMSEAEVRVVPHPKKISPEVRAFAIVKDADCKFEPTVMAVVAVRESYTGHVNLVVTFVLVPFNAMAD